MQTWYLIFSAAIEFYSNKLGFEPGFTWGDPPTMADVNLGCVQIFLEQGATNPKGRQAENCCPSASPRKPRKDTNVF